uniref:Bifunctional inhibitor/plant lipid transfer protein/seed storage helical domain-containing protein n=1 Tax=Ananas comosus var. bracteatus TaxID=296719 RepID=A0A6V7NJD7_ANACO|nr:unnamed protein product [Ananas comosus var. bracteatus]
MAHFRVINCLLLLGFFAPAGGSVAVPDLRGGSGKAPTPDCCKGLQEVVAQSFKCLCVLVKDRDEPALGFKFNVTRALFLPSMCQVPANVTDCPRLLNLPANSADAQVFEQFGRQLKNISNNNTATDDEPIQEEMEKGALPQQIREVEPRPNSSENTEILVPHNIQEAFKCPKWKIAVDEEVRALEKNGTWEIAELPRDKKPVGCGHEEELCQIKQCLAKEFEIKDLGNLKFFLGMEIERSKKGITVSQRKYVVDLPSETEMLGCKPVETPMDSTVKLDNNDSSAPVDKERYQRLVEKLLYLAHTRLDIGFLVSVLEIGEDMRYEERPVRILACESRKLRNRVIPFVKVQWSNHEEREATWEPETVMRESYPYF